ncbi:hypothetical protein KY290_002125 [Solanum tuberosum]|uniref:Uncharacterized protein n=1 Tax=Solanum tuberosum TaxID=4113 RepID=A0ABQ7WP64_SOLTU|nr:hypothetical protein KY289_002287 [Solanum tuberosum]KAH0782527.1 hypothetical protein KY290_002125 [Solanum tuberosum]
MANSKIQTPAYPSAAKLADSDCYPQYTASLKCKLNCHFVWNSLAQRRANAKNILMFTRNARKKRGKLGWSAIEVGLYSHES